MVETSATGRPGVDFSAVAEDIIPSVDDTYDLGSLDKRWALLYVVLALLGSVTIGGVVNLAISGGVLVINDSTQIQGDLTVDENLIVTGNLTVLGNTTTLNVTEVNINGSAFPQFDNLFDLGKSAFRWRDIFLGGNALINGSVVADGNVTGSFFKGDGSQLTGIQHGGLDLFMLNNASDISGSKILFTDIGVQTSTTLSKGITATNTEYQNWTTNDGVPNLHLLVDGVNEMHIHARVTSSGAKDTTLLWKLFQNDTSNNINLLFTSKESLILTDTMTPFSILKSINDIDLNDSDRLTVQLVVNIAGGGSDPTVEVEIEGDSDSRVELVVPNANVGTFVPYVRAIFNLDLGPHNFSVDSSVLFVDSNIDRVGIGMTGPSEKLDVAGAIKASGAIYGNRADRFAFYAISGGIYAAGLVDNYFGGNVGINTTTPQNLLNVLGDANITGLIYGNGSQLTNLPVIAETDPKWTGNQSLIYNKTEVDTNITDANLTMKNYVGARDITFNTSSKVYSDAQDIVANTSATNWVDVFFVRFTELVGQVGNWTADKSSYYTKTQTDTEITNANTTMKNYADFTFLQNNTIVYFSKLGVADSTPSSALEVTGNITLSDANNCIIFNSGGKICSGV